MVTLPESERMACPFCARTMERHAVAMGAGLETPEPSAGDVTVCAHCGAIVVFTEAGTLAKPTFLQMKRLKASRANYRAICRLRDVIQKFNQARPHAR